VQVLEILRSTYNKHLIEKSLYINRSFKTFNRYQSFLQDQKQDMNPFFQLNRPDL
jgi:hypothetical protein